MLPTVSIVIPVYNGADFLDDAIRSALAQTYPNIEVIVVNDGSDDDGASERIALAYNGHIRYFAKVNGGVASALNRAIEAMSGEYFSWLSHDDLYRPDKIEAQMAALSALPVAERTRAIVYSDCAVFTDDPEQAVPMPLRKVVPGRFRYWLTVESSLHGCALLIPRSAFDECGLFDESLRTSQDYDLWFRMAERFCFIHVPLPLVKARSHAGQGSRQLAAAALAEGNALFTRFVKTLAPAELGAMPGRGASRAYADLAASLWCRGFRAAGNIAAWLALRCRPASFGTEGVAVVGILARGWLRHHLFTLVRAVLPPRQRLALRRVARLIGARASGN